ncbi:MAG: rod shape-determining protein MreD [Chitinispirillaceae bacterium]
MTTKIWKWTGLFLLCFILQSTLVPYVKIFGVQPDLILLVLFLLSIKAGVMPGVYIGFLLGLGQDLFSAEILGQNALAKTIVGFLAGLFNEKVIRLDPVLQAVLLIMIFAVNDAVVMTVQIVKMGDPLNLVAGELLTATLPRAMYSLVFAIVPFVWDNVIQPVTRR